MRLVAVLVLASLPAIAHAQQGTPRSAPNLKTLASSTEVTTLVATLKKDRTAAQPMVSAPLLNLTPYTVTIEYRVAVGNGAVHDTEAELFYVLDGAATLTTGGELVDTKRTNPQNSSGSSIRGGSAQTVSKGDFIMVPAGTPHWFSTITGSITLMSLHLPMPK